MIARIPAALALTVALGACVAPARAQTTVTTGSERVTFVLSGGVQMRASVGISRIGGDTARRIGFGVRRARFRALASYGERAGMYVQFDGSSGTASVLDFFAYYDVSDRLRLRAGRMASAQPRSMILTSMAVIDVADRAAAADRWAAATIGGSGRDFGVDATYRRDRTTAHLFLHNGDGDWSRSRGNYRQVIVGGDATGGVERSALAMTAAVSHRLAALKGVEIGGFAGYNANGNPNTERGGTGRTYATAGTHAYYGATPGSQAVRLKLDVIGVQYEALTTELDGQFMLGVSALGAVRPVPYAEAFARIEIVDADTHRDADDDVYATAGATFSLSARRGEEFRRERVTLAWARYAPSGLGLEPEDLILLQLQLWF